MYSDGDREAQLLEKLLQHPDGPTGANRTGEPACEDFVFQYHLSPTRHNLLKWFPFLSDASLLDIGCGCGALTGLLAEKVARVTALEYSPRRARIAALRHKALKNLQVIIGGLQDFTPNERYNYITMIGVLEYAPRFFGGPEPQQSFLRRAAEFLEPDGALIIAIENKIGLKYLTGAPEDHTGIMFESIYDYPNSNGVRTLSRKELSELLGSAGFDCLEWFYPFPDYKLPQIIFSDHFTPDAQDRVWELGSNKGSHREVISEKLLGRTLARAGLFQEFANSFLVVARRRPDVRKTARCLKFTGASSRRLPQYQLDSLLFVKDGEMVLRKQPATRQAGAFPGIIAEREKRATNFFVSSATVVKGTLENGGINYPFLAHPTLEGLISGKLRDGLVTEANALLEKYCLFVRNLPCTKVRPRDFIESFGIRLKTAPQEVACLEAGPIDLVPANILVAPERWQLLDHEWFFDFPVPVEFIVYRGLATLVTNLQDLIRSNVRENPLVLVEGYGKKRTYMPMKWLKLIDNREIPLQAFSYWNWCFQAHALHCCKPHRTRLKSNPRVIFDITSPWTRLREGLHWHAEELRLRRNRLLDDVNSNLNRLLLHLRS